MKNMEERAQLNSATYHGQYVITVQMSNYIRQHQSSRRGVGCPAYKSVVFKENDGASGIG